MLEAVFGDLGIVHLAIIGGVIFLGAWAVASRFG